MEKKDCVPRKYKQVIFKNLYNRKYIYFLNNQLKIMPSIY